MSYGDIIKRVDGSYLINNGMYHVPDNDEFTTLWATVDAYAKANPDRVAPEPPPAEPALEEVMAARIAKIKAELVLLDIAKIRPLETIASGTATDDERTILAELSAQTLLLREELHILEEA